MSYLYKHPTRRQLVYHKPDIIAMPIDLFVKGFVIEVVIRTAIYCAYHLTLLLT
jgi:hypothetical protein